MKTTALRCACRHNGRWLALCALHLPDWFGAHRIAAAVSKAMNRVLFELTQKIDNLLLGRFCQALLGIGSPHRLQRRQAPRCAVRPTGGHDGNGTEVVGARGIRGTFAQFGRV